ncbi:hypothetical protein, partial [Chitinophaga sp. GbtcB8]|uniref:hypothetical protein n=1 Tax=Chitinophaga sp. GbtcB8 TaxID=2824753 RepID=UPI001C303C86
VIERVKKEMRVKQLFQQVLPRTCLFFFQLQDAAVLPGPLLRQYYRQAVLQVTLCCNGIFPLKGVVR